MQTDTDPLLSIGEVARRLGVSVDTLRNWEEAGRVSSTRTSGGHRRFRGSEVARLMIEREGESA